MKREIVLWVVLCVNFLVTLLLTFRVNRIEGLLAAGFGRRRGG